MIILKAIDNQSQHNMLASFFPFGGMVEQVNECSSAKKYV